jgi:signal transduction histidine kinase
VWLRFSVSNSGTRSNRLYLEVAYPILDEVELYAPDSNGDYKRTFMGEVMSFDKRTYKHPNYIFDLRIPAKATYTYYLRVRSAEQIILPVSINRGTGLWQHLEQENLISGIYLGIVLIMVMYNLFLFFSVKDRSYVYYVLYVAFTGLTQIGIRGYNFQYLWGNNPAFEAKSVILFASLSGIATMLFTRHFLHLKVYPRINMVISALILIFAASLVATTIGHIQQGFMLMQLATSLGAIILFLVSLYIMIKGYPPAKFFFSAWSVLLVGAVVFLLKDYGILPYNTFTSYSFQAATAIEMALLSFGLADKINILKKEKETVQAQALAIAKENERIIREQNVQLETKVKARTLELNNSNVELQHALDDLKQAQTQLVESEKMASLGQLTAGIAHEINNPINFVTANVTPLRRDVDMLLDALNTVEEIGLSELPVAEKQAKIEAYKEELDFDYLKIEVGHLLKGIYEGASRTAEIVKGLRIFSRVDEDDLKRADINEGLDSTLVIVNNILNKIQVVKEYGNLPLLECYPGKLNQVFLNIISNAIHAVHKKFGPAEGGQITISTDSTADHVIVKIRDNGTGMDEHTKKKIFEPFFTTKDVGEGTGLGMSIAYNTIKKHNGQIFVWSAPGEGTEFTLQLPKVFVMPEI